MPEERDRYAVPFIFSLRRTDYVREVLMHAKPNKTKYRQVTTAVLVDQPTLASTGPRQLSSTPDLDPNIISFH